MKRRNKKSKHTTTFRTNFWLLIGMVCLLVVIVFTITNASVKQTATSPAALLSITPTPAPFVIEDIDLDTTHWKTYVGHIGNETKAPRFSIKHPQGWNFIKDDFRTVYYPFGKTDKDTSSTFFSPMIILGTYGHGGTPSSYQKIFTAGEARYAWSVSEENKVVAFASFKGGYLFEVSGIPVKNAEEAEKLQKIFDTMLNTFEPLDN